MPIHAQSEQIYRFDEFAFFEEGGRLYRGPTQVKLQPQPSKVLAYLLQRAPAIVSREELGELIWPDVNVDLDLSLNYCVRQIRSALQDSASQPRFVETLPKQGYRFIAAVQDSAQAPEPTPPSEEEPSAHGKPAADQPSSTDTATPVAGSTLSRSSRSPLLWTSIGVGLLGIAGGLVLHPHPNQTEPVVRYEQLTDFTGAVRNPVLSPDGRLLAFLRGDSSFGGSGFIYVRMLPDGEPKLISNDPRPKYNLAFSPDASRIAYTVWESDGFSTYSVSTLGGQPRLVLKNAAGLTWLGPHQYLFSRIRSGLHLGIVTSSDVGEQVRELYYPQHERAMAHYSFASPDHASAIVVEMDEQGGWAPCRLVDLRRGTPTRYVGPLGPCTYAGWSPDGSTMFFIATIDGHSHLWSQRTPDGKPQQITNDPSEEEGMAVEASGRSVITSIGVQESAIWIHSATGERALSSEGQVVADPAFSSDGKTVYFLLQQRNTSAGPQLWRASVSSSRGEPVLPGTAMTAFHVSADESQVVYTAGKNSQLWLASLDGSSRPRNVQVSGSTSPHFGPEGEIIFVRSEGNFNFLERINQDGSGRAKISSAPVIELLSISPGQRWLTTVIPGSTADDKPATAAFDLRGGSFRRLFAGYCIPEWSSDGKLLSIPVEPSSPTSPGMSLLVPVGAEETLPPFPPAGLRANADPAAVPGSRSFPRADFVPGRMPSLYAYVKSQEQRNLYRVMLPASHPKTR
jgi:DNA-binding winged helix-turn-helix (wHTH) protein/Tol biopolymer transport system component